MDTLKVAEYVAQFISELTPRVYGVCGAGAMHLNDAIANHPGIRVISMQHEQAAAIAAEAETRVTGKMSVVMVTAGPGGTNAMTGVACAYVDSIPMLVIAGQVTLSTMKIDSRVRQVGMNELDMVSAMTPFTKCAMTLRDPQNVRSVLEWAVLMANRGRKGPVFVEIPLDIQASTIDPDALLGIDKTFRAERNLSLDAQAMTVQAKLSNAKRPLIIIGNGVRLADAITEFKNTFDGMGVPIVSSWGGADIMPTDHPHYIGRCGIFGDRASNFAVQTADVILALGTRLTAGQIGHSSDLFAPSAFKIIVDIDDNELDRKQTVRPDVAVKADVKDFLKNLRLRFIEYAKWNKWLAHCQNMKKKYPPQWKVPTSGISSYGFIEQMSDQLEDNAIVVTDVGFCFIPTFQALRLRSGQRLIHSGGVSPMGWGIPAAIGAAFSGQRAVVCLTGDGGAMFNLQELQTVAHHRLKIAIFVYENDGYATMKIAQNNHFKREVMSGPRSGLSLPDFTKIAKALNITTMEFNSLNTLSHAMESIFDISSQGPIIVVMHMDPTELISPRVQARTEDGKFVPADIADMWPHLPREEFALNLNQGELHGIRRIE